MILLLSRLCFAVLATFSAIVGHIYTATVMNNYLIFCGWLQVVIVIMNSYTLFALVLELGGFSCLFHDNFPPDHLNLLWHFAQILSVVFKSISPI